MTSTERHEQAVTQSLRWAKDAAASGDFEQALEWLTVVELVDGALPPEWEQERSSWLVRSTSTEGATDEAPGPAEPRTNAPPEATKRVTQLDTSVADALGRAMTKSGLVP